MRTRSITKLALLAAVVGAGAAAAVIVAVDPDRQEQVRERGATVMPFSLDATTHVFRAQRTGGTQLVVAKDPRDERNIRLIREHLREEAAAFARGDFDDPASVHGAEMPGLRELSAGYERIDVEYRNRPDGAALIYRTSDPSLAAALERWFDAQLGDHGRDAERATGSGRSHTEHPGNEE